jgi:hypothetical protein
MGDRPENDAWPHTGRALPWMLAGFMAMVWLVPFDAVTLPIPLPLDGKLDRLVLGMLLLVWITTLLVAPESERPRMWFTWIHVAAAVLLLIVVAGAVLNAHDLVNLGEFTLVLKKLALLLSSVLFFVIVASVVRVSEVPSYISLMLGLSCIAALGILIEYRLHYNPFYQLTNAVLPGHVTLPSDLHERDSTGRVQVYGPGGHPLETAAMMGLSLPFAMGRMLDSPDRRQKLINAAIAAILVAGAFATLRKTSVVAPAAGVLVLFAYRPRAMLRHFVPFAVGMFVLVHVLAPGALGSLTTQLSPNRLVGVLSTQDRASDFDGTRPDYTSHVLLGRGFQSYDPHKYSILDNQYLGLILGVGLLGMAAYLAVMIATGAMAHAGVRSGDPIRGPVALGAAAATAVMIVSTGLFDLLSYPHVPYLFFFIGGVIVACARPARRPAPSPVLTRFEQGAVQC